jgi:pyridoxine 4-dehydrogenase
MVHEQRGNILSSFLSIQENKITIGGINVNRIGLGTNRITDSAASHALLRRAIELNVNFIDTAWRYTAGESETAIGKALAPYPDSILIATKGGWDEDRPENLRGYLEDSLRRLKLSSMDLYQLHRVNPHVPIEDSVGALKKLQDEGKIRHIGLSEVSVDQLKRAQRIVPIISVQNRYNVLSREHEAMVDYCTRNGIVFIPWYPLGGLSGGAEAVKTKLLVLAAKYHATPQQIALAWLLKRSPMILPIPGTLSISHLESNLLAAEINLSSEDFKQLL